MQNKCKKIHDKINSTFVQHLRESQFYKQDFLRSFDECLELVGKSARNLEIQIICYGLGSFHNGVDVAPRYQLALLLLLYKHLVEVGLSVRNFIEVFDPSFEQLDTQTLLAFSGPKFKLIDTNEHCARKLDSNKLSLIYMPHLDKYLYNNLLGSNWTSERLGNFVVLGNSFHEMIDNDVPAKRVSELYYMNNLTGNFGKHIGRQDSTPRKGAGRRKIKSRDMDMSETLSETLTTTVANVAAPARALVELKINDGSFEHSDIFNNLAFHFVDENWLKNNAGTVEQTRLKDWQPVESQCENDLDWPE